MIRGDLCRGGESAEHEMTGVGGGDEANNKQARDLKLF